MGFLELAENFRDSALEAREWLMQLFKGITERPFPISDCLAVATPKNAAFVVVMVQLGAIDSMATF